MFQGLKIKRKITVHLLTAKERKEIQGAGWRIGFHRLGLNHPCLYSELFFFPPSHLG